MLKRTACLAAALWSVGCGTSAANSKNAIKIGLLLPYTGEDGSDGANFERGIFLAADQITAAGGLYKTPIQIIEADTHSDVTRGLAAAQTLIDAGVIALIGPENDALAQQLAPILTAHNIIFITPSSSSGLASGESDASLWFRLAPSSSDLGIALARQIASDGVRKVTIINTPDTYEVGFAAAVAKRLATSGSIKVTAQALAIDTSDFSAAIAALVTANPDAIVLAADPTTASSFVNQFAVLASALKVRWYLSPTLQTPVFVLNSIPNVIEGMVGVAAAVGTDSQPFVEAFASRWNGAVPTTGAFFYYDALALFAIAFEEAAQESSSGMPSSTALHDRILKASGASGLVVDWNQVTQGITAASEGSAVDYSGITGVITLDTSGARSTAYTQLWTIKNNQLATLSAR